MADDARRTGIYVYTLGRGPCTDHSEKLGALGVVGAFEKGNAVLMNMANDTNAPNYNIETADRGLCLCGG